jgi:hypothetical protein
MKNIFRVRCHICNKVIKGKPAEIPAGSLYNPYVSAHSSCAKKEGYE